jgi:hypothetical protein
MAAATRTQAGIMGMPTGSLTNYGNQVRVNHGHRVGFEKIGGFENGPQARSLAGNAAEDGNQLFNCAQ